ncbi:MAG: iron-sulfur cluster assembly scaffold protein [Eubacteriales bacterium]
MEYTEKVIDHFMSPRNVGSMPDADGEGEYGDSGCGDSLVMYIKVKDNVITKIKYLIFGCAASVATSSMMSVLAEGKTIDEAEKITENDIVEALDGLPDNKIHCSVLGAQALKNAIMNYRENQNEENEYMNALKIN